VADGLRLAKDYRAALRAGLTQLTKTGSLPRDVVAATNVYLASMGERRSLVKGASGWELLRYWHIESAGDYLVPIATSFAKFIASADLTRVRKCRNPACILFFYDTSKSGTRSWCSLDICGNKMRVAAFRDRRARR
jgi:predicted RNA-binding Zn ribbon-like protein